MSEIHQLAYFGGEPVCQSPLDCAYTWPRITPDIERAVIAQLKESISIYDRSSIFKTFEIAFAQYHKVAFSLLSNSGTSAIFSMFDAVAIGAGDEVLCPVYTFHAAVSPMMSLGAIPIFCDCDHYGNITLKEIETRVTSKTRAVIVTHMWGTPVQDSIKIRQFCDQKNIYLLEDCSHAHGATYSHQVVGSFGHAAAWSLQGQKVITGGEGGIMLTNNKDIYARALIHGHYNKRPKKEISTNSQYYPYCLTDKGLKLRAHPLVIVIAYQHFLQLDRYLKVKSAHMEGLDTVIDAIPFLSRPRCSAAKNSGYAYGFHYSSELAHGLSRAKFCNYSMLRDCKNLIYRTQRV